MTTTLSAADRKRLAAILGMLGSNASGERDNAASRGQQLLEYALDNPIGILYQAGGIMIFAVLFVRWAMGLPIN
jgi:hypothetical protein